MDLSNWMLPEVLRELGGAPANNNNSSEAQKRFIMFDKSGDRGRIVFSPNRFYELPSLAAPGAVADEQAANLLHVYREAMASFTALQSLRERSSSPYVVTLCDMHADDTDSSSKLSWDASNHASSSAYEEDSDDIDALLESDDEDDEEDSTGHSPSDVTDERDTSSQDEITSGFTGVNSGEEGDDADVLMMMGEKCIRGGGSPPVERKPKQVGGARRLMMKKQRKDKIRHTLKALQSLIPGGDSMDAALVLDEAIHYMKSLQMKVVELEANRQAMI